MEVSFPSHIGHMLDYLHDIASGPIGRSVPGDIAASLAFMEKVGAVAMGDRISTQDLWLANVAEIRMRCETNNTTVRRAPQYLIVMILSLELFVCSERPRYIRAVAWIKLVKVWASLRSDDVQGIDVRRLTLNTVCLRGVLAQTKTTGAGKKTWVVPIFVYRQASFSGHDWVKTGFDLWSSAEYNFP
jgi:hypothetical protein